MGGSAQTGKFGIGKALLNYLVVFTFVALWHDISLNLLIWGWLIVLFMVPEVLAGLLFPRRKWENHLTAYRWLCGAGGVLNLLMMMAANLVGFAVGVDGLKAIVVGIFGDFSGIVFLTTASAAVFVGVQVMMELREQEMREGIYLKC
jgi:D-alanyl-lipoteichoic acid acyltransferase DltB (MBOAT superfamily)